MAERLRERAGSVDYPAAASISHDAGASFTPSAAGLLLRAAVVALAADKTYVLAGVVTQGGR